MFKANFPSWEGNKGWVFDNQPLKHVTTQSCIDFCFSSYFLLDQKVTKNQEYNNGHVFSEIVQNN